MRENPYGSPLTEVKWAKMTFCKQKALERNDSVRFSWNLNDVIDIYMDTGVPLKTAFVNGLKGEVPKALKILQEDWDCI